MVKIEHRSEYNRLQEEKKRRERFILFRFFYKENWAWQLAAVFTLLLLVGAWFIISDNDGRNINSVFRPTVTSIDSGLGYEFFISSQDENIKKLLHHGRVKYSNEANLIRKILKKGDIAIDIGAGFGYHTVMMALDVGNDGLVYAFEPNPKTRSILRASIGYNGLENCIVKDALPFSSNTEIGLQLFDKHMQFYKITSQPNNDHKSDQHYQVTAQTLDSLMPNLGQVRLIRINAGGAELEVIKGAHRILANSPKLSILMYWDVQKLSDYSNIDSVINNLFDMGFEFWDILQYDKMRLITKDSLYQYNGYILISKDEVS